MSQNLEKIGSDVRTQGGQGTGSMSELIFNPETGEFETKSTSSEISDNEMIVTSMTREGFAL